ncbi:27374_t:CDS:2, partial [Gigaspora margarita]
QAEDQDEDQAEDQVEDHNKPHPCIKYKYCPKIFKCGIATRMQAHLNNTCLGAPENAKSNSKQKNIQSNISIPHISTSSHIPKQSKTIPINNFIDHLDNKEQESLEYILAQALFATGVLFSFLDNPYVIKFFQYANFRIYALCDEFWKDLDLVTNILQPIVAILKIFESDNTMLSSIYSNFRKMINIIQDISCYFLNEIQSCIEPIEYNIFNTFTNQKFEQKKSVELFVEIVKFQNKSFPYDDYIIWELAATLNPALWWESCPDSSLKQLAIKVLKISTSSAAAEQNFSTFVNSKNGIKINNSKTNQKINHEIYDENREVENIIYTEGICRDINKTEQIYLSNIENNSMMELESEYGIIYI